MTKQPKRTEVEETDQYCGTFTGPLESIITSLQNRIEQGWEGIRSESYGYDGGVEYYLYKHRPENDTEYETRMKLLEKEEEQKLKAKEHRRKEYEKLKKEFGDD